MLFCPCAAQGHLDLVGVSQLVQALDPRLGVMRGSAAYFMALFDLDGDGQVRWSGFVYTVPCLNACCPAAHLQFARGDVHVRLNTANSTVHFSGQQLRCLGCLR